MDFLFLTHPLKEAKMKKNIQTLIAVDNLIDEFNEKLLCYQCERWFPKILATYFPFGMSDNPFKPLCQSCSDLIEGAIE